MVVAGEWNISSLSSTSTFRSENSNNEKNDWTTPPDDRYKKVSNDPERFEKKIGSKTVKWCTKCGGRNSPGRWTTSHFIDEHVPRNKLPERNRNANLATEEKSEETPQPEADKKISWGDALARAAGPK